MLYVATCTACAILQKQIWTRDDLMEWAKARICSGITHLKQMHRKRVWKKKKVHTRNEI